MPEPESIREALSAAEAEVTRLTKQIAAVRDAEAEAIAALAAKNDALMGERDRRKSELAETRERIRPLLFKQEAFLSRRHQLQRGLQEVTRLALGTIGFVGWLMAATSGDFDGGVLFGLLAAEAAALWFLGNLANKEEQR